MKVSLPYIYRRKILLKESIVLWSTPKSTVMETNLMVCIQSLRIWVEGRNGGAGHTGA